MFAADGAPAWPVRRGRGLLVALALHAVVAIPFLVSAIRVVSTRAPAVESAGVTVVLTPLRGVGSPLPASDPAMERPRDARVRPAPAVAAAPAPLTVESLAPLAPLSASDRPPPAAFSDDGAALAAGADAPSSAPLSDASEAGSGGAAQSPLAPAIGSESGQSNWAGLVLGRLEQFRRYPAAARRRRLEGVSSVRFTIDREGHVLRCTLARTSGHALLDREALDLVRRADPLPAPPAEVEGETVTLTVPVEFFLAR